MREIKFRALNKMTGKIVQVEHLEEQDIYLNPLKGIFVKLTDDGSCGDPECCGSPSYFMDQLSYLTPLQYTGLKDKNGKEIYANDCLGGVFECLYVDWCNKQGGWELFTGGNECMACMGEIHWWEVVEDKDLEVIGNKYENPELLNV